MRITRGGIRSSATVRSLSVLVSLRTGAVITRSAHATQAHGQALTIEQAESIIAALREGRFRLYGLVGLCTGMRAGELAGLRVRNIDFDRLTIRVMETVEDLKGVLQPGEPKTRRSKGRYIYVPRGVLDDVAVFIESAALGADD